MPTYFVLAFFLQAGGSCVVVAVSVALRFFNCMPPKYFLPVKTLESCFALTSNRSHTSLAVPSLKYLQFIFSQTATASIWVGPFLGLWAKHGVFAMGKIVFWTFSCLSSSVVFGHLSSTGFRNPSGTFICMSGWTAPLMTMCIVTLSVILAKALMLAHNIDRCLCASNTWSNMNTMKAVSSARHVFLGNWQMNSCPDGMPSGGSKTLNPPLVRCWWR